MKESHENDPNHIVTWNGNPTTTKSNPTTTKSNYETNIRYMNMVQCRKQRNIYVS